jgi:hypothetical protein
MVGGDNSFVVRCFSRYVRLETLMNMKFSGKGALLGPIPGPALPSLQFGSASLVLMLASCTLNFTEKENISYMHVRLDSISKYIL